MLKLFQPNVCSTVQKIVKEKQGDTFIGVEVNNSRDITQEKVQAKLLSNSILKSKAKPKGGNKKQRASMGANASSGVIANNGKKKMFNRFNKKRAAKRPKVTQSKADKAMAGVTGCPATTEPTKDMSIRTSNPAYHPHPYLIPNSSIK